MKREHRKLASAQERGEGPSADTEVADTTTRTSKLRQHFHPVVVVDREILQPQLRCPLCGGDITVSSTYCAKCVPAANRENLLRQGELGRIATHSAIAEARRAATHAKQVEALRRWNPSDLPKWLDEEFYRREILPRLSAFTVKTIRLTIDVSHPYATLIQRGISIPHPRHWVPLAELTGCLNAVSCASDLVVNRYPRD